MVHDDVDPHVVSRCSRGMRRRATKQFGHTSLLETGDRDGPNWNMVQRALNQPEYGWRRPERGWERGVKGGNHLRDAVQAGVPLQPATPPMGGRSRLRQAQSMPLGAADSRCW